MRKAGIAEMYVVVNHAGQQPLTVGIDYGIGLRSLIGQVDACYDLIINQDRCALHLPLIDRHGIFDESPAHYACGAAGFWGYLRNQLDIFRRITPKNASLKMPPLILDVPSSRFTNITGTSLILNPHL